MEKIVCQSLLCYILSFVASHAIADCANFISIKWRVTSDHVGIQQLVIDLLFTVPLIVKHTGERGKANVPASVRNPRIYWTELYTVVLRKTPYWRVNSAAVFLPVLFLSGLREKLLYHIINGSLVFFDGVV